MRIVYATEILPWMAGMTWRNARFFTEPVDGVEQVFVHGDFPRIVAAYRARGVSVILNGPEGLGRAPVQLDPPPKTLGRKSRRRNRKSAPTRG